VVVRRWQEQTGGEAKLAGTRQSFAELEQERASAPAEAAE
jgi:hypothetical protein